VLKTVIETHYNLKFIWMSKLNKFFSLQDKKPMNSLCSSGILTRRKPFRVMSRFICCKDLIFSFLHAPIQSPPVSYVPLEVDGTWMHHWMFNLAWALLKRPNEENKVLRKKGRQIKHFISRRLLDLMLQMDDFGTSLGTYYLWYLYKVVRAKIHMNGMIAFSSF